MSGPKLLDKKVVNTEVATQRKQQIDLGLSISKKVDAIRDTLSAEEQNLENFRRETIARVQVEIDTRLRERDVLKEEIIVLEGRKALALIPLTKEWEEVKREQMIVLKDNQRLEEKSFNLMEREKEIEQEEKEVVDEKARVTSLKDRVTETLVEAEITLTNAREEGARIRNTAQTLLTKIELHEQDVFAKEEELETREQTVAKETAHWTILEANLASREKKLQHRQELFTRKVNYLKNK